MLEQHLAGCTRCALEVAQIRALRRLLTSPEVWEAPSGLRERLLDIGRDGGPDPEDGHDPDVGHDADAGCDADPAAAVPPLPLPLPLPRTGADPSPASRPLVGAVGLVAAGLVVLGAAAAGAVVTGVTTPAPGTSPTASLTAVLPGLLSWPADPDAASTVRPVDNGDRP